MAVTWVTIKSRLRVDDLLHVGTTMSGTEKEAAKIVTTMKELNGRPNSDKSGLISMAPRAKGVQIQAATIQVHGDTIEASGPRDYFKLAGAPVLSGEKRILRINPYPENSGKMAVRSREMAIPSCEHGIRTAAMTGDWLHCMRDFRNRR